MTQHTAKKKKHPQHTQPLKITTVETRRHTGRQATYLLKCIRVPKSWRHAQALMASPRELEGKPGGHGIGPDSGHGPGCLPSCSCSSHSSCANNDDIAVAPTDSNVSILSPRAGRYGTLPVSTKLGKNSRGDIPSSSRPAGFSYVRGRGETTYHCTPVGAARTRFISVYKSTRASEDNKNQIRPP